MNLVYVAGAQGSSESRKDSLSVGGGSMLFLPTVAFVVESPALRESAPGWYLERN